MSYSPNQGALREPRQGVAVHYPAADFVTAARYCRDPASKVSYNRLIAGDGAVDVMVPDGRRAWSMGVCRPSSPVFDYGDANSAFVSFAVAGGPGLGPVTFAQVHALAVELQDCFARLDWDWRETWRITTHAAEAWPRGRKADTGAWLPLERIVAAFIAAGPGR